MRGDEEIYQSILANMRIYEDKSLILHKYIYPTRTFSHKSTTTKFNMTEIQSIKAFEQAITDGETSIMLTTERFLVACAMAERCGFDKTNIGRYIGLVQTAQWDKHVRRDPDFSIGLLNDQGKPYKAFINLTILANTLRIIQLLDDLHARLTMNKDENGNYTGVADITTFV